MELPQLNFPLFEFRISSSGMNETIFDPIRKKMVRLTPEEWVRQNLIAYLVKIKEFPVSLIGVEKQFLISGMPRRFDIAIFNRQAKPLLLAECKAPSVTISSEVFDQAARYNLELKVDYFLLTNGLEHYCCRLDYTNNAYIFLENIPGAGALI